MKELIITESIHYIEAGAEPLSADVGIIQAGGHIWLYDVGNGVESLALLPKGCRVVLSHFHADHSGNLAFAAPEAVYGSGETVRHTHTGTVVTSDLVVDGLRIFPLPSSHAKGCLGLEVNGTYAFVGDALYCKVRDGFYCYNAQLLRDEIAVLKGLRADTLLVSHRPGLVQPKAEAIARLEAIYALREKNCPEIRVPMDEN